jgi:hypothetical protein
VSSWRDLSRSPLLGACGISPWSFPSGLLLVELSNGICPRSRGDLLAESSFEGFRSLSLVSPLGGAPRELFTEGLPNRMPSNGTSSLGAFEVFAAECSSGIALQGARQRESSLLAGISPRGVLLWRRRNLLPGLSFGAAPTGVRQRESSLLAGIPPRGVLLWRRRNPPIRGYPSGLLLPELANGSLPCLQGSLLAESSSGSVRDPPIGAFPRDRSFGSSPTGVFLRDFSLRGAPGRSVQGSSSRSFPFGTVPSGALLPSFSSGRNSLELSFRARFLGVLSCGSHRTVLRGVAPTGASLGNLLEGSPPRTHFEARVSSKPEHGFSWSALPGALHNGG